MSKPREFYNVEEGVMERYVKEKAYDDMKAKADALADKAKICTDKILSEFRGNESVAKIAVPEFLELKQAIEFYRGEVE